MGRLVKKIAYLTPSLDFLKANKEFLTYFESATLRCEHFLDFVVEHEKKFFKKIVDSNPEPSQIFHFELLKNTGEYKNNVVNISVEGYGENRVITVTTFDIEELLLFNFENSLEERRIRRALSITDEYFFYYDDISSNFKIFHFHQNSKVLDFNQNIDDWREDVIKEGLVDKNSIPQLDVFIHDLKSITASSISTIRCAIRSRSEKMFENLKFIGVAVSDDAENAAVRVNDNHIKYGSFVVGRILTEAEMQRAKNSTALLSELQLDSLTNIFNKKTITEFAQNRIAANKNSGVALIIVDLDHFKPVNDVYGHLSGDAVLSKAATILKELVGDDGYAGRFGGDEFMLVVENLNSEPILRGFLRSIQSSIRLAFEKMFDGIQITASIGCAMHPKDGTTYEELFKKADFCLYRAKNKGRDRYVFYREDLHREEYEKMSNTQTEGGKIEVRDVLELKYMAKFYSDMVKTPKKAIVDILNHMLEDYKLDGITLYYGQEMKQVYHLGSEQNPIDAKFALTKEYKTLLGDNAFVKTDFVSDLHDSECGVYKKAMMDSGVKSCVSFILGDKENIQGLILFSRVTFQQLFANYEFDCITMFCSTMNLCKDLLRNIKK